MFYISTKLLKNTIKLGAFCTTPTSNMLLECNILPLETQRHLVTRRLPKSFYNNQDSTLGTNVKNVKKSKIAPVILSK